ncbi:MAG: type II toxin-antitoxin system antitoxin DNA ADP-ribosyl glycohydrolase DarG [Egibacteraceae bacterium]
MIARVRKGDLFTSGAQTLVNTINTVGVMGKGVALQFKRRFPAMFADYQRRCAAGQVKLGEPYLWRNPDGPSIVNFPTKEHWRSVSRLADIERGLVYLAEHIEPWSVTSLAVPPLGAGNGGLDWSAVGPTLYRHLARLPIPVTLYAPFDVPDQQASVEFLAAGPRTACADGRLAASALVLAEMVRRVHEARHAWPVGRIRLQKLAYFATAVGVPTGLEFTERNYGPFTPDLDPIVSGLVNNGVLVEVHSGRMHAVQPGPTFDDASARYADIISLHERAIDHVADLLVRLDTKRSEIAATVHFAAGALAARLARRPTEREVLGKVMAWKQHRRPPLVELDIVLAIRDLAAIGWLDVTPSPDLPPFDDDPITLA